MAGTQEAATQTAEKTAKVIDTAVPKGGLAQNYGPVMGGAGIVIAILTLMGKSPQSAFELLGQFGPKWIYFAGLTFILWDLLKRALKIGGRGVASLGDLATNVGRVGDAVQQLATKNDRATEEQQRLTSFAVQTSQRAVEISSENLAQTKVNTDLLQQMLLAKQGPHA